MPFLHLPPQSENPTSLPELTPEVSAVPTAVRFNGLNAYGPKDAGFFLELLPGDGVQLPASILFWKTRIEARVKSDSFAVGLLSGESGSGKSSFLRAGLLPRVASHVRSIYVEASPGRSAHDLLDALRERGLAKENDTLETAIRSIAAGERLKPGEKLLLAIDQFEQELQSHPQFDGNELVEALRKCDGRRLQALLVVRDGFDSTLHEFGRELSLRWDTLNNWAAIERFTPPHAERLLERFGRALGRLPAGEQDLTPKQKKFLSAASKQLVIEGKVSPVHIALFVETVRERDWSPEALEGFAGPSELGVRLLEQRFDGPHVNPEYAHYRPVIVKFLTALLPESVISKSGATAASAAAGHSLKTARSQADLAAACGLSADSKDFQDVLRILSRELPLVTFAEFDRQTFSLERAPQVRLAHDTLVPAVREWINRTEAKTAAGRARIALRERTAAWLASNRLKRELPTLAETFQIRRHVPKHVRSPLQNEMLRAALRHHLLRNVLPHCLIVALTLTAGIGGWMMNELDSRNDDLNRVLGILDTRQDELVQSNRLMEEINSRQRELQGQLWLERGIRELADHNYERGWAILAEAARNLPNDSKFQSTIENHVTRSVAFVQSIHVGEVQALAFNPSDGSIIAVNGDGFVRQWKNETGLPIGESWEHSGSVIAVAYDPDSASLITGSNDGFARRWDVATGTMVGEPWEHGYRVISVAFSPDGTLAMTGGNDGFARLWDVATGTMIGEPWEHFGYRHDWVDAVAFSPDSTRVVSGSGGYPRLWDVATGTIIGEPWNHVGQIYAVAFSPDGRRVITGGYDSARLWDVETGTPIGEPWEHVGRVDAVAFSPDGERVATGCTDGIVRIWETETGTLIGQPWKLNDAVFFVEFTSNGQQIVTGCRDGFVRFREVETGIMIGEPWTQPLNVTAAAFSQSGGQVVTGSVDGFARIREFATDTPIGGPLGAGSPVTAVALSSDGRQVVTGCNGTVRLWDVTTGSLIGEPWKHGDWVPSMAFCPNGGRVATGCDDGFVRLWDTETGAPIGEPWEHGSPVYALAFSPDGGRVVTGCGDGFVRLWNVETGTLIGKPWEQGSAIFDLEFSPDGGQVVTGCEDDSVQLWDVVSGTPADEPWKHGDMVNAVKFSPDGTRVVTSCHDGFARLWDVATGTLIGDPYNEDGAIVAFSFGEDGDSIFAACNDGSVWRCFDVKPYHHLLPEAWAGLTVVDGVVRSIPVQPQAELWETIYNDGRG